jgi:predicted nucleic acid-binding Zn ribbon protein
VPWSRLPTPDATGDGRAPSQLPELLDVVLSGLGAPKAETIVAIHEAWETIVGVEVAAHAHPISVEDGCLRVGVDSPAWANHLQWSERQIVERLDRLVGPEAVVRVTTRVSRR